MMRSVSCLLRRVTIITLALLALVSLPATTLAQTHGAVTGAVLDPSGQAVAGAGIIVRNEATGDVRATATDNTGRFSVSGLPAGVYTVEVGAPGFDVVRKSGLRVTEAGQPADAM